MSARYPVPQRPLCTTSPRAFRGLRADVEGWSSGLGHPRAMAPRASHPAGTPNDWSKGAAGLRRAKKSARGLLAPTRAATAWWRRRCPRASKARPTRSTRRAPAGALSASLVAVDVALPAGERQHDDGGVQQAGVAGVSEPGALGLVVPERGRLVAFEDDESPALGVAGRRGVGGESQGPLERLRVNRALEKASAHTPFGDQLRVPTSCKLVAGRGPAEMECRPMLVGFYLAWQVFVNCLNKRPLTDNRGHAGTRQPKC